MLGFISSKTAAEKTVKARWELTHKRELKGCYAQGRVGRKTK